MSLTITSSTIDFQTTQSTFVLSGMNYQLTGIANFKFASPIGGSSLTFIPQKTATENTVGSQGYATYLYDTQNPNDDFPTIEVLLSPQLVNTCIKFRLDIGAQLFDIDAGTIDGQTAGSIWCLARWSSSGILTVTNIRKIYYRTTFVSGTTQNRISVEITDASGNACLPVAIGNALYLKYRKSNITHGTRYDTQTHAYLYGLNTFERYAFFAPTLSTVGHGNGVYN